MPASGRSTSSLGLVRKLGLLILGNLLVLVFLFGTLEIAHRIYVDGFGPTLHSLGTFGSGDGPELPEDHWVVRDPELGYRLNPALAGVNSLSIRGPEIARAGPDESFRILYLGNSVAFDRPGFVSRTRDALADGARLQVINASVPGYTSYQQVLLYEKYLAQVAPDLVVWTYCLNDNHRFLHRFGEDGRMLLTSEARSRLALGPPWDGLVRWSYVLRRIHLAVVSLTTREEEAGERFEWESHAGVAIAWKDAPWERYERNLERLLALLDRSETDLIVVSFPLRSQLTHATRDTLTESELAYVRKPQRRLRSILDRHDVPYLDLFPTFLREADRGRVLYRDRIHLNPAGHAVAARQILVALRERRLIPTEGP